MNMLEASSAVLNPKTPEGSQWLYFQGGDWARLLTARGLKLMSIPQADWRLSGTGRLKNIIGHSFGNTLPPAQAGYCSLLSWSTAEIKYDFSFQVM